MSARHSFVDGLVATMLSASAGSLAELVGTLEEGRYPRIEVFALTRATHGRVRITGLPNGMTASLKCAGRCGEAAREQGLQTAAVISSITADQ